MSLTVSAARAADAGGPAAVRLHPAERPPAVGVPDKQRQRRLWHHILSARPRGLRPPPGACIVSTYLAMSFDCISGACPSHQAPCIGTKSLCSRPVLHGCAAAPICVHSLYDTLAPSGHACGGAAPHATARAHTRPRQAAPWAAAGAIAGGPSCGRRRSAAGRAARGRPRWRPRR